MTLAEMKERLQALLNQVSTLQTSDEDGATEKLVNVLDEAEKLQASIATKERAEKLQAFAAAPAPNPIKRQSPTPVPAPKSLQNKADKLDSFVAALPFGGSRLQNALTGDGFEEGVSANGGYILPVDKRELVKLLAPPDMVHGLCDILYTSSNATTVPLDADPVWSSDLGANDVAEGAALTEDESAFGTLTLTLVKSGVLVRVTREMLDDNTGIGQWVTTKLGEKLAWKLHAKAIAAFKASGGKVTVAKTSNAAAGSAPDLANIQKMWSSMLAPMRSKAVWLINPSIESALQNLVIGTVPVYIPPTGIEGQPYGRLFGRPVFVVEGLDAQGTEGDIMLVDPSSFYCVLKTQGARIEESIHAEFKNDVVQYRGYVRSVFASKFAAVVTRPDSTTAGNVITLATRA